MYVNVFCLLIVLFCLCCRQSILPIADTQLDEDTILFVKHCVLSQFDYNVADTFDRNFLLWYYLASRNISISNFHTDYQLDKCLVTHPIDPVHVNVNSVLDKSRALFNIKSINSASTNTAVYSISICTVIMTLHLV